MNKDKLQKKLNQMYAQEVQSYDSNHGIADAERLIWQESVFASEQFNDVQKILDVGTGTGMLARLLVELGYAVTGVEPVRNMLEQAKLLTNENKHSVDYVLGDSHEPELFAASSFDCVVSRQVVCHFHDPLMVFSNWRRWLSDGGLVVLTDGLWSRADWNNDEVVDRLPLSCVQTRATLNYLLEKTGFQVIRNEFMDAVNQPSKNMDDPNSLLYLIIAQKV